MTLKPTGGTTSGKLPVAIYARVSTTDQNSDMQTRELTDYAGKQGWEVVEIYQDVISGAKSSRPGLNCLIADAAARKFDCLLVWKLDRFGRSLVDCLNNIKALEDHGIRFIATTQGLDTDQRNPASRFLLHVLQWTVYFPSSVSGEGENGGLVSYGSKK